MSAPHSAAIDAYTRLLDAWNRRDAAAYAALFTPDASVTGFDGSQMQGVAEIESQLGAIFAHHPTASYVGKVREVRELAPGVTLLRAVAGMRPPGASTLNPAVHAIQSVILQHDAGGGAPRIALFQNTPAAFHGRPELVEALTAELSAVLASGSTVSTG